MLRLVRAAHAAWLDLTGTADSRSRSRGEQSIRGGPTASGLNDAHSSAAASERWGDQSLANARTSLMPAR